MPVLSLGMPTLIGLPALEDCAMLCHELGLQFIELNMNLPHYQPGQMDAAHMRALTQEYDLYFTIHLDENMNVSDFNPLVASAWQETARRTIALALEIGCPTLNMHLPRGVYFTLPERRVFLFDAYKERYLQSILDFRMLYQREAGDSPLRLCIENTNGYLPFQLEALDLLLQSPLFGLTFDVGHHHASGSADEAVILSRAGKLCHMHLHDARGKQNHLPLGEGEMDIRHYLSLAVVRRCRVVLEVKTPDALRQCVARLPNFLPDFQKND